MKAFQSGFVGKASPVHLFWGSFDLATTRYSGPARADAIRAGCPNCPDWVMEEAYSREECSVGLWPSSESHGPMFYAYAYPEPAGYEQARIHCRRARRSIPSSASSSCPGTPFAWPRTRTGRCCRSSSPPMRPARTSVDGTGRSWSPPPLRAGRRSGPGAPSRNSLRFRHGVAAAAPYPGATSRRSRWR